MTYKGIQLDCNYRTDFVIEDHLALEIKAAEQLLAIHDAQLLTYLILSSATFESAF